MKSQTPQQTLAKAQGLLDRLEAYWQWRIKQREALEAYLRRTGDVK